eukprot:CAMPEP_0195512172 /NCGR_PEP_ID=MMETSP0794_2-20130614/4224_1 /TAXON_ID=515487 /ORGANISM="Stephanopyxis turris, Strain CCMP 815" /LENGTH=77 /DNA_ID=CAMNT_0040639899 /DNA_START=82 /DNA_END=312 /DNA_ORIENTATION=+
MASAKVQVTAKIAVDGIEKEFKCGETSESATYPFNEKCDRKQPLTMKGDTYYAQVVKMIESVKTSTNDFLSEHLQSQ